MVEIRWSSEIVRGTEGLWCRVSSFLLSACGFLFTRVTSGFAGCVFILFVVKVPRFSVQA